MKRKLITFGMLGSLGIVSVLLLTINRPHGSLATVDGTPITEEGFRYWWERDQPAEDTADTRRQVLDAVIERTALANSAREAGLDRDPEIVEAIESLLIARLKETELQPKLAAVKVSDEEARAHYEEHRDDYTSAPARHVAVLWFNTRGLEPLAQRYQPRLKAIRTELAADPDSTTLDQGFGSHALANTEHRASRHRGGDLGWIDEQQGNDPWRNDVLALAMKLDEPGALSPVTATEHGIFLVRLIARRESTARPFEDVRPRIVEALARQKRTALEESFLAGHGKGRQVTIDHDRLADLKDLNTRASSPKGLPKLNLSLNK